MPGIPVVGDVRFEPGAVGGRDVVKAHLTIGEGQSLLLDGVHPPQMFRQALIIGRGGRCPRRGEGRPLGHGIARPGIRPRGPRAVRDGRQPSDSSGIGLHRRQGLLGVEAAGPHLAHQRLESRRFSQGPPACFGLQGVQPADEVLMHRVIRNALGDIFPPRVDDAAHVAGGGAYPLAVLRGGRDVRRAVPAFQQGVALLQPRPPVVGGLERRAVGLRQGVELNLAGGHLRPDALQPVGLGLPLGVGNFQRRPVAF